MKYPGVTPIRGGRFHLRVKAICPRTGRKLEATKTVFAGSASEAAALREELRQEISSGAEATERIRLGDASRSWMTSMLGTVRQSTAKTYASAIDALVDVLGDHYLDTIDEDILVAWRDGQLKDVGRVTINGRVRVVRQMFRVVSKRYGIRNPAEDLRCLAVPQKDDDERENTLTAEELVAFLRAVRMHAPQWYPLLLTLITTGARFGEVSALAWSSIEWDKGVIRIRRAHCRGVIDKTKTGPKRTVVLDENLASVLREHRAKLIADDHVGLPSGLVFPSRVGKLLHGTASFRKPLLAALAKAEIGGRFTAHGLRRTMNNLLRQVAGGVVVRSITGHVTEEMTEHYSHVGLNEKRAAVRDALGSVLAAASAANDPIVPVEVGPSVGPTPSGLDAVG